ncbi:MAG TPA: hypothetical protein DIU15_02780 [Deltaproteobacteria bacterium]|nr:hypothetical protein [Deltaproteobacteria bacterium]HCP44940.1 hypothetical protein [Deltaproteobacteria bacterium]
MTSPTLQIAGLSYRYPSGSAPAVGPLDLEVSRGEVLLVSGPTGCGKSTLARLIAGLVQRHGRGELHGSVLLDGADPSLLPRPEMPSRLGFVSQDPSDQIVAATIGDEIAFGLESSGWERGALVARVEEIIHKLGLPADPERSSRALSGGQKQRLVVGAAVAAGARVLVLDEPLSQLDPAAGRDLLERLRRAADGGMVVVLVEHRIESCLPYCDRVLLLDQGQAAFLGPRSQLPTETLRKLGLAVPAMDDLQDRLECAPDDLPQALLELLQRPRVAHTASTEPERVFLQTIEPLSYSYGSNDSGHQALQGVDLCLKAGDRVAILGANGSGKSTLLSLLAGHLPASLNSTGRILHVPQDPDLTLFCASVEEELAYGPMEWGLDPAACQQRALRAARALSLEPLLHRPPQALSRGQRVRTAVAAALTCQPTVLLVDEPTSGQDGSHVAGMMDTITEELANGSLVFATHDVDVALRYSTRVLVLHEGRQVLAGPPSRILFDLPPELPLLLPPLARWCEEHEVPYASVQELNDRCSSGGQP